VTTYIKIFLNALWVVQTAIQKNL